MCASFHFTAPLCFLNPIRTNKKFHNTLFFIYIYIFLLLFLRFRGQFFFTWNSFGRGSFFLQFFRNILVFFRNLCIIFTKFWEMELKPHFTYAPWNENKNKFFWIEFLFLGIPSEIPVTFSSSTRSFLLSFDSFHSTFLTLFLKLFSWNFHQFFLLFSENFILFDNIFSPSFGFHRESNAFDSVWLLTGTIRSK